MIKTLSKKKKFNMKFYYNRKKKLYKINVI